MSETIEQRLARIRPALAAAGQEHVLRFFGKIAPDGRLRLLEQLEAIDLTLLCRLIDEVRRDAPVAALDLDRLEPPQVVPLPRAETDIEHRQAVETGEELLRAGKVAAFVVAGGQGTRLGFDGPKGCFPIGPLSRCSLFEWHFAKVAAMRRRFGAAIPMLVMTSPANHEATASFLAQHRYFGLPAEDVILFRQGMLPAVDPAGRLLLAAPDSLALAPDGHGGSLLALAVEGVLDELDRRGIEEIYYFQVDNPLARILDPAFLGHHRRSGSDMSSKVVNKRDAAEKVGVFARVGATLGIVEYSDLPAELGAATDAHGQLRFRAGNIAIHAIRFDFVRRLTRHGLQLPYHRALKVIAAIGEDGRPTEPTRPNGIKFETFVFDALPLAERTVLVEADRAEEFSPVKNKDGEDSVDSARRDLRRLFHSWIEAAGFGLADPQAAVEIAPSYAVDRDEFVRRLKHEKLLPGNGLMMS